jgi:hypothetical protein
MATPTKTELGAFAQGEVPPDLQITFTDFNQAAVDLTGFTNLQMNIEAELAGTAGFGTGTIVMTDAVNGIVTYTWDRADMQTIEEFTVQAWVDNGTKYFASDLYIYTVYDGPGTPP